MLNNGVAFGAESVLRTKGRIGGRAFRYSEKKIYIVYMKGHVYIPAMALEQFILIISRYP